MKKIGLVTVLFNSANVLPDFFSSLVRQTHGNYHVYIIDNSLDDHSFVAAQELISQHGIKDVSLIKNSDNVGVAEANNQGIALALADACDYVLILNNDIVFTDEHLFENMLLLAEQKKEKIVVPKIYYHDTGLLWYAGGKLNAWTCRTPHLGDREPDEGQYDQSGHTGYAPTCFMLVHQSVFETVGLMDPHYFVYYDDTDFVFRCKQKGLGVYYWPAGKVWHKVSSSTGGADNPFSIYYCNRNRRYFIDKNLNGFQRIFALNIYLATFVAKNLIYRGRNRLALNNGFKAGRANSVELRG